MPNRRTVRLATISSIRAPKLALNDQNGLEIVDMSEPHCSLCAWILEHEADIRNGGADLNGVVMTEATEVVCYQWAVSLLVITLDGETSHHLKEKDPGGSIPTLISALLGWWAFPSGPLKTLGAIGKNTSGGVRSTVAALMAEQRWGIKVLDGAALVSQEQSLVDLSHEALMEIERRRTVNGFEDDLAVRLLPDSKEYRTCLVQFDYPASDGNQWLSRTQGLTVVIEKSDADYFANHKIHFDGSDFIVFEA